MLTPSIRWCAELSSESDTDSASQTESDFSDLSASDLSQSESDTEEKGAQSIIHSFASDCACGSCIAILIACVARLSV